MLLHTCSSWESAGASASELSNGRWQLKCWKSPRPLGTELMMFLAPHFREHMWLKLPSAQKNISCIIRTKTFACHLLIYSARGVFGAYLLLTCFSIQDYVVVTGKNVYLKETLKAHVQSGRHRYRVSRLIRLISTGHLFHTCLSVFSWQEHFAFSHVAIAKKFGLRSRDDKEEGGRTGHRCAKVETCISAHQSETAARLALPLQHVRFKAKSLNAQQLRRKVGSGEPRVYDIKKKNRIKGISVGGREEIQKD